MMKMEKYNEMVSIHGKERKADIKYLECHQDLEKESDHESVLNEQSASKLKLLGIITAVHVLIQLCISVRFGSLALLSDSIHNLSDVAALGLALFMHRLENRKVDANLFPYGYKRAQVIGGLINCISLMTLCAYVSSSAIPRLFTPAEVDASWLFIGVAASGIVVNSFGVFLFMGKAKKTANLPVSPSLSTASIRTDDIEQGSASEISIDSPYSSPQALIHQPADHNLKDTACHGHGHDHSHDHGHSKSHHNHEHSHLTSQCHDNHVLSKVHKIVSLSDVSIVGSLDFQNKDFLSCKQDMKCLTANGHEIAKACSSGHSCSAQPWYAHSHNHHTHSHTGNNMNLWAVLVHSAIDTLSSAVICTATLIMRFAGTPGVVDWTDFLDPIVSILLSVLTAVSIWPIIQESVHILMDGSPNGINAKLIRDDILCLKGVKAIKFLAITQLNSQDCYIASLHLVVDSKGGSSEILKEARSILALYNINRYATIELEVHRCSDHHHCP